MLRKPICWQLFNVFVKISVFIFVQVICREVSMPNTLNMYSAISKLNSLVDPEDPHVMSLKVGPKDFIFCNRLNKFCFPAAVFGGKNSKDQLISLFISLSVTFILLRHGGYSFSCYVTENQSYETCKIHESNIIQNLR
eukprot:NODE_598_length_6262_cov_0.141652.p5 type:complete len:138 gc:universal NODE_598_length_6262_cov_0.141652:3587-3174(-)